MARVRFPFRWKLSLLAAGVSVVPLGLVGWWLAALDEREVVATTRQLQIALAEDIARTASLVLDDAASGLGAVGRALSDRDSTPDVRLPTALGLVEASPSLDLVGLFDASGALIDVVREDGVLASVGQRPLPLALRAEADEQGRAIGEARREPDGVRVTVAVPIRAEDRVTGYAVGLVALDRVAERVDRLRHMHLGIAPRSLLVVDERLRLLAGDEFDEPLADLRAEGALAGIRPGEAPLAPRSAEIEDAGGVRRVATVAAVDGSPWLVVVQVPRDDVYASIDATRRIVIGSVALAIAVALALGLGAARRITEPVLALAGLAKDLAARRFDRRVELDTGDELSDLAAAMNGAARDLADSEATIRKEAAIRADLGRYLPREVAERIVAREQDMALGGRRATITVLFADVVAFTPLAERLPPEQTVALLNELFTLLTEIVFRHGGTVDKFVGDSVMALWGAPEPDPEHARHALAAAQDMLRWVETASAGFVERFGVKIDLAIGVSTGEAVVGNVGSAERMEYTAIGDVVNVAARLESIARPGQVLCTDATRAAVNGAFALGDAGEKALVGRALPVHLWELGP